MAADATGIVSILGALGAGGVGLAQWLLKGKDQIDKEREQRAKEREAEQARREKEAEEDREAISRRLAALESKVSVHDLADARHDRQLNPSELLVEIRDELREMRHALLERPGSSPEVDDDRCDEVPTDFSRPPASRLARARATAPHRGARAHGGLAPRDLLLGVQALRRGLTTTARSSAAPSPTRTANAPDHCIPARDTSPTASGANVAYLGCFRAKPSADEGIADFVRP